MSLINKLTSSLALVGVLLVTALTSSNASALHITGLNPSGIPAFVTNVTVRINKGKVTVKTNGGGNTDRLFSLVTSNGVINGTNANYNFRTNFDSNNNWIDGNDSLRLNGQISSLGINTTSELVTADLSAFAWDPLQPSLLGWNTDNIWCNPDLMLNCTPSESVYVLLGTAFDGDFWGAKNFTTSGIAVTTVPVPAAVWLFGSGLAFLGATARRRRARG